MSTQAARAPAPFVMRNRLEKPCKVCGHPVPSGAGYAARERTEFEDGSYSEGWSTYCEDDLIYPKPLTPEQAAQKEAEDAEKSLSCLVLPGALLDPATHTSTVGHQAFPYQVEGARWLQRRQRALLADDQGLGKTIQILLALPKGIACRALLIVPASVKGNWKAECQRWRPDLRPRILEGTKGGSARFVPSPGEVLICNYDILPGEKSAPNLGPGAIVILDEAQAVKNYKTARHKRVKALVKPGVRAWFLTGTPMLNKPPDLYSVLQAGGMDQAVFGHFGRFCALMGGQKGRFGMEWKGKIDPKVPSLLRRAMLRRLKSEVLKDLPPKLFQDLEIDHLPPHLVQDLDDAWEEYQEFLKGKDEDELPPLERFSDLRAKLAEAKTVVACEWIDDYINAQDGTEEPKPLVVMSAHKAPVHAIAERFGFGVITGDVPPEERTRIVADFQEGRIPGVACTIQAAGVGLTLTRADTMFFVDLDWTPALNLQAQDRIHRIGQHHPCLYVTLTAGHVLERHLSRLLMVKAEAQHQAIDAPGAEIAVARGEEIEGESDEAFAERMVQVERKLRAKEAREALERHEREQARLAALSMEEESLDDREAEIRAQRKERAKQHATTILGRERAKARLKGDVAPRMSKARAEATREAVAYLASVCDGAVSRDGQGFSKVDTALGHMLATAGLEDGSDALMAAFYIVRRYPKQVRDRWPVLWLGDSGNPETEKENS